ncbi:hypothetical protein [Spirilliplanes yamanashiensis]|uniref:Uncharacterized protein n=1 Tax=Spirilliplanes yamanashiensis TaxID=42233 RepID=A0A8J3Y9T2_9ACTN|nr:hypothetical protein [Spirilliplanes yamanashiensis]MDP9815845.1 hypothetical protein [Spirilliplanes yamanashiensis]GIJ04100.1 hypothetical protein Sya03_34520 [Spirilliplanes yamanashiensis]
MSALVAMRLTAFVRGGRAAVPLIAALVVLGVLYGGGQAGVAEGYGVSAAVLFPVLAWQSKLLLDAEPDVQRHLARVTLGERREWTAGLLAALAAGLVTAAIAMAAPWVTGGMRTPRGAEPPLAVGLALGVWAHLLALAAGVALGALACRAVTRGVLPGVAVLVTGGVLGIVLGLRGSIAPWLVPPLMPAARALTDTGPTAAEVGLLTAHAVAWAAAVIAGYAWLRRRRA